MFCLYHFSLKYIIKNIYRRTVPLYVDTRIYIRALNFAAKNRGTEHDFNIQDVKKILQNLVCNILTLFYSIFITLFKK